MQYAVSIMHKYLMHTTYYLKKIKALWLENLFQKTAILGKLKSI